ncbi:unnamed protein product [Enterobius vermicularis]|uniref:Cytochrome P450 n=1 Tax=Enterobius vermicularis TaxID=51028 RepID=A0A0N4VKR4_ENTVE|nr:unnamed protein product [Enterobius vermicularis]
MLCAHNISTSVVCLEMILLIIGLFYITMASPYCYKRSRYWKDRNIPGPVSIPFIGNFFKAISDEIPEGYVFRDWTKQYGKYYGFQVGQTNILAINDLNMVRQLFIQKFDNFHGRRVRGIGRNPDTTPEVHIFNACGYRWRRLRTISAPIFTTGNIKKVSATAEKTSQFKIILNYQEMAMDIISRVAVGQKRIHSYNFWKKIIRILQDKKFIQGLQRSEKMMSENEIVANSLLFLLAGYDTTSNSLAFLTWHLARDQQRLKKLQQEIDEICTTQVNLDVTILRILMGTHVVVDGKDPDKFISESFEALKKKINLRNCVAYLPFGLGPRQYIGMSFALMEEKLAICHLVRRFNLFTGPDSEDSLGVQGFFIINLISVHVYLKRRKIGINNAVS